MTDDILRILLFTSPAGLAKGTVKKPDFGIQPLGILYLASFLAKQANFKYELKIIDAYTFGYTSDVIRRSIADFNPHIVGVSAVTILIYDAQYICSIAKQVNRNILTIIGGPHAASIPADVVRHKDTDLAVVGEGEYTFLELCCAIRNNKDWHLIPGIAYQENGHPIITAPRPFVIDLDNIPYPDLSLLPDLKYYNPMPHWGQRGRFTTMITSRGCPYNCTYCSVTSTQGSTYRFRSALNVFQELRLSYETLGINSVSFRDGTFTTNRQRVIDLCDMLRKSGMKIKWSCNTRANELDRDLLHKMKETGCNYIFFGIEQGNEELLFRHKRYRKEQITNATKWTKEAGIDVMGYFMLGMPEEDMTTLKETISFAKSLPLNSAVFTILTPLPGTALYKYCEANSLLLGMGWDKFDARENVVWNHPVLSEEQLQKTMKQAYRAFYLRPSVIANRFSRIRSLKELLNHFKIASVFLK